MIDSDFFNINDEIKKFISTPFCHCDKQCVEKVSRKTGKERWFYSCSVCNFFEWKDQNDNNSNNNNHDLSKINDMIKEERHPDERKIVTFEKFKKSYIIPMYSEKNVEIFLNYCKSKGYRCQESDMIDSVILGWDVLIRAGKFNSISKTCKIISKRKDWKTYPKLIKDTPNINEKCIKDLYRLYIEYNGKNIEDKIDDDGFWILDNDFSDFIKSPLDNIHIDYIVFIDNFNIIVCEREKLASYIRENKDDEKKFSRGDKYIFIKSSKLNKIKINLNLL